MSYRDNLIPGQIQPDLPALYLTERGQDGVPEASMNSPAKRLSELLELSDNIKELNASLAILRAGLVEHHADIERIRRSAGLVGWASLTLRQAVLVSVLTTLLWGLGMAPENAARIAAGLFLLLWLGVCVVSLFWYVSLSPLVGHLTKAIRALDEAGIVGPSAPVLAEEDRKRF